MLLCRLDWWVCGKQSLSLSLCGASRTVSYLKDRRGCEDFQKQLLELADKMGSVNMDFEQSQRLVLVWQEQKLKDCGPGADTTLVA